MAQIGRNARNMSEGADLTPSKPQQHSQASNLRSNGHNKAMRKTMEPQETATTQYPAFSPRYASSASDDDTDSDPDLGFASDRDSEQRLPVTQSQASSQPTQPRSGTTLSKQLPKRLVDSEDEGDSNLPLTNTNLGLIRSDEIDGPTDFTENIEYWMKLKKPTKTVPGRLEEEEDKKLRDEMEEWVGSNPAEDDDDDVASQVNRSGHLDEKLKEQPKRDSHAEETPQNQIQDHQMIVEQKDAYIRALQAELARIRDEHELSSKRVLETNTRLERDLKEFKSLNDFLHGSLELVQKDSDDVVSQRDTAHQAKIDKIILQHKAELDELKLRHQAELQNTQQERSRSGSQKSLQENWSSSMERESEIKKLRIELAAKTGEAEELQVEMLEKVETLESQLRTKEAVVKTLETRLGEQDRKKKLLEEELDRSRETHAEMQVQLDNAEHEGRIARDVFEDEQLEAGKREKKLKEALEKAEKKASEVEKLKAEIEELEREHERELQMLTIETGEELLQMRSRAEMAVKKTGDLLDKEKKEVQRLKSEADNKTVSEGDLRNELLLVNDQVEDLSRERDSFKSKLEKVVAALEKEQDGSKKVKIELAELKKELTAVSGALKEEKLVSEEAAKRVTELVAEREREWKRRLNELKMEMELRSKLLMIEWGRKEVGEKENLVPKGVIQGYKYQFKEGQFIQE